MKWMIKCTLLFSLLFLSLTAFSFNLSFLNDTATQMFTQRDWAMVDSISEKALNTYPNHKKANWVNPKNGHSGYVEPLDRFNKNGKICRNLKIVNRANSQKDQYVFTFCKYNQRWKIPGEKI